jgi:tetratricopeptide (TPR) repeat protein
LNTLAVLLVFCAALASSKAQDLAEEWSRLSEAVGSAYRAGEYVRGAELAEEALRVARSAFGDTDQRTLTSLNNLAFLYERQGRYGDAEPLYGQALERSREALGPDHPDTLQSLNNLAFLYERQGRYGDAEPLLEQALERFRETLGPDHPDTYKASTTWPPCTIARGAMTRPGRSMRRPLSAPARPSAPTTPTPSPASTT